MLSALVVGVSLLQGQLPAGSGQATLDLGGTKMEVFTFKPESREIRRLIVVFHGVLRNADEYRDHSVEMAKRFDALVVAPKFDSERFPSRKYQFGGILDENRKAVPAEEWTYSFIPKLAKAVREREGKPDMPYFLIGHSAGGQFVARMAAFQDTGAERMVAANPGSHLFPHRDAPFGYGFGNLPPELSGDEVLQKYLASPLTLYLGTADDKPDEYFDSSTEAMKQGQGRYQRGKACFEAAKKLAESKGWKFGWRLVEAEGVAHDHEKMFNHERCREALFGGPSELR